MRSFGTLRAVHRLLSGSSGVARPPIFPFLGEATAAAASAGPDPTAATTGCADRLLTDLRSRYANAIDPGSHASHQLAAAFAAAADCGLTRRDAARLQQFFETEAPRWRLGDSATWLSRAMRLLAAVARTRTGSPPLFESLAEYALDAEPLRSCPTTLLAVANAAAAVASSSAGSTSAARLLHRALDRLLETAGPSQLRAMSGVASRLLVAHPDRELYERWREFWAKPAALTSDVADVKSQTLVAQYGTDAELFQLYAAAETAWETGGGAGHMGNLGRKYWPLSGDFIDGLAASGRLETAADLRLRLLEPMRDRRGLALTTCGAARLLALLGKFSGRSWSVRPVALSDAALPGPGRACPACGYRLSSTDGGHSAGLYRPAPDAAMTSALEAEARRVLEAEDGHRNAGGPALLAAHRRWLTSQTKGGPFHLVVDASNLLLHRGLYQNTIRLQYTQDLALSKLSAAIQLVQQNPEAPQLGSPMLVGVVLKIGGNWKNLASSLQKGLAQIPRRHPGVSTAALFLTAHGDDLLALLTALQSGPGCFMLSSDQFRDHSYRLSGRVDFIDWQLERQISYPHFEDGVLPPVGTPCRSDTLPPGGDDVSWVRRGMHLLAATDSTTEGAGAEQSLAPAVRWLCVRPVD